MSINQNLINTIVEKRSDINNLTVVQNFQGQGGSKSILRADDGNLFALEENGNKARLVDIKDDRYLTAATSPESFKDIPFMTLGLDKNSETPVNNEAVN